MTHMHITRWQRDAGWPTRLGDPQLIYCSKEHLRGVPGDRAGIASERLEMTNEATKTKTARVISLLSEDLFSLEDRTE